MPRGIQAALKSGIVEETQVVDAAGNMRRDALWVLTPEEDQQIRSGYRCPFDMQVFREAFPEECVICAQTPNRRWFSPRKHQAQVYARMVEGEQRWGPSPLDDYDFEADEWKPSGGSQILLPGRDF